MPDDYLVAILNGYNKEFNDEFNSFAEEYKKSEEFIELSTKFRKHHRILKYINKNLCSLIQSFKI